MKTQMNVKFYESTFANDPIQLTTQKWTLAINLNFTRNLFSRTCDGQRAKIAKKPF